MLGIKPGAAGSGSKHANHCAMLPRSLIFTFWSLLLSLGSFLLHNDPLQDLGLGQEHRLPQQQRISNRVSGGLPPTTARKCLQPGALQPEVSQPFILAD